MWKLRRVCVEATEGVWRLGRVCVEAREGVCGG